ncbi:hypothetical protein VKI21_02300 [Cyanobacterium aponinum UTEX 3222]|uniref:hypothetical protein n=1 Tax=Cyanobacterium aponinum TaxID=379064 RepID=UPI003084C757|nr:hypothetical protein VKI21_02300 [Cyanobacterium aponinum UTEX 3222]
MDNTDNKLSILFLDRDNIILEKVIWDTVNNYLLIAEPMRIVVGNRQTIRAKTVHKLVDEGWLVLYSGSRKQASDLAIKIILTKHYTILLEATLITTDLKLAKYFLFNPLHNSILKHYYNPLSKKLVTVYRSVQSTKYIA